MSLLFETSAGDVSFDLDYDNYPFHCRKVIELASEKKYKGAIVTKVIKNSFVTIGQLQIQESANMDIDKSGFLKEQAHYSNIEVGALFASLDEISVVPFSLSIALETISVYKDCAIYGKVVEGFDIFKRISRLVTDLTQRPLLNIIVKHVLIVFDPYEMPIKSIDSPVVKHSDRAEYQHSDTWNTHKLEIAAQKAKLEAQENMLVLLGDLPHYDANPLDTLLFVCKLSPYTIEEDLELIFSQFGTINSCNVIRDWKTGHSLQYAFINFTEKEACERAYLKMNNVLIDNCRIVVDFAQSTSKQYQSFVRKRKMKVKRIHKGLKSGQL